MIVIMSQWQHIFKPERLQRFAPGDTVFRSGSTVKRVFLVKAGCTALTRPLPSGEQVMLQRASSGNIIAEASVYAHKYHCDCQALEATELAYPPLKSFIDKLRSDTQLAEAWAGYLARSVQQARMRAEIRSLKTVAERLDAWIGEYGEMPPKGHWQEVADELSVSREALYRELARRRSA